MVLNELHINQCHETHNTTQPKMRFCKKYCRKTACLLFIRNLDSVKTTITIFKACFTILAKLVSVLYNRRPKAEKSETSFIKLNMLYES